MCQDSQAHRLGEVTWLYISGDNRKYMKLEDKLSLIKHVPTFPEPVSNSMFFLSKPGPPHQNLLLVGEMPDSNKGLVSIF